jgi:hypothetical protein
MRHRHDSERGDKQLHPGEQSSRLPHYAARSDQPLYDGLPLVTDRAGGPDRSDDMGGYGGSTGHQGRYGESQGRHAQSGHGRGGVEFAGHSHDSEPSRGIAPDRPVS